MTREKLPEIHAVIREGGNTFRVWGKDSMRKVVLTNNWRLETPAERTWCIGECLPNYSRIWFISVAMFFHDLSLLKVSFSFLSRLPGMEHYCLSQADRANKAAIYHNPDVCYGLREEFLLRRSLGSWVDGSDLLAHRCEEP